MGTHAHTLTPLKPSTLPRRFIIFAGAPTVYRDLGRGSQLIHSLRVGYCRALRRTAVNCWDQWDDAFDTSDQLITLLCKRATRREVTWIVCNELAYQWVLCGLGIAGVAGKICVEGYNFTGRVKTARLRIAGKVCHLVDMQNYLDKSLGWIGCALGVALPDPPSDSDGDSDALEKARLEVEIISEFVQRLVHMSGDEMQGAWGWSLGSLAWHSYRAGLMADQIHVHADEEATALEREAYLGGRTECRFIGATSRPITVVDYNSLYAHCMVDNPMPCRLLGVHGETVKSLSAGIESGLLAVATVTVDARKHDCPMLLWDDVSSPPSERPPASSYSAISKRWRRVWGRGQFQTTLATPELRRALEADEIASVARVSWYKPGVPFSRFVSHWYEKRLAYRSKHLPTEEAICKRILTVLPGKLGQHARDWIECDAVQCKTLTGHWWSYDHTEKCWRVYRALRGCAQVYGRPGEWKHSCPAISAHVTSAARAATDAAVSEAGLYDCFYFNADECHVTALGLDRLGQAGLIHETQLGKMKVKGTYDGGLYRNARDYRLGTAVHDKGQTGEQERVARVGCQSTDKARAPGSGYNNDNNVQHQPTIRSNRDCDQLFIAGTDCWRRSLCSAPVSRYRYSGRVNKSGWVEPMWLTPRPDDKGLFGGK